MSTRITLLQLKKNATQATGLDDFGDTPFEEALQCLIDALEREARLDDKRRAETIRSLTSTLVKRLQLAADSKKYPEIAEETINAPIFIVGLPRTGSTNLHSLIAQCEGIRAPRIWEMYMPSPPPAAATYLTDARIAMVQQGLTATISDELMTRHPMAADRPEQCNMLSDIAFMNWATLASYEIPSYRHWLLTADHTPSYQAHKQMLQQLQWQHPGQWVLKYPKHMFALDALLATYPDAKFIWTHRDPGKVIPSVISLIETFRKATPGYDPKQLGREWATFEELGLHRGLSVRDRAIAPNQIFDVHYSDVLRDPVGSIAAAFQHFGMTLSDQSRDNIRAFVADNPQTKHGVHTYTAEQYGLDETRLRNTHRSYIERFKLQ